MERFLVVGVDTIAGANLAACLAERYAVATWCAEPGIEIANCDALDPADAPAALISRCRPDWILYCGPAARSCWEPDVLEHLSDDAVVDAAAWAAAVQDTGARIAMISSDAVFTGPWMFHEENSHGVCPSYHSQVIRATEMQFTPLGEQALILRTNTFGWSPLGEHGWLETCLRMVETKRIVEQDHIRHATPILATDLADIVERACRENLSGIHHIAGAERVNPLQFVQRLANLFELPWLAMRRETSLTETPAGFGKGECSLQTKSVRKALCVAMPLLSEGLGRLHEQCENGFREKLCGNRPAAATPQRRAA